MKIGELLLTTITELNFELAKYPDLEVLVDWGRIFEIGYALEIDRKRSLIQLQYLIGQVSELEATSDSLICFQDFLAQRWQVIRQTDASYPSNTQIGINTIAWLLAIDIAPILNQSSYALLMPTMTHPVNEISGTDWQDLQVQEFVLSDEDSRFIVVEDCLVSGEETGIFKHDSLFLQEENADLPPIVKCLSASELSRVRQHSREAYFYEQSIRQLVEFKDKGLSLGSFVKRLINQLMAGGVHAMVDDRDHQVEVGPAAVDGITEFYSFLLLLTQDELNTIMLSTAPSLLAGDSFQVVWYRLMTRAVMLGRVQMSEQALNVMITYLAGLRFEDQPCIELFAQDLEKILKNNDRLYTIFPAHVERVGHLGENVSQSYSQAVAENQLKMKNVAKNLSPHQKKLYGARGDALFVTKVIQGLMTYFSPEKIIRYLTKNQLNELILQLDKTHIQLLVSNVYLFNDVMRIAKATQRLRILSQLEELTLKNIFTQHNIKPMLRTLSDAEALQLIGQFSPQNLLELASESCFLKILLTDLSLAVQKGYLARLGQDLFSSVINNVYDFYEMVRLLPDLQFFMGLLTAERIKNLFANISKIHTFIDRLSLTDKKIFFHFVGVPNIRSVLVANTDLGLLLRSQDADMQRFIMNEVVGKEFLQSLIETKSGFIQFICSLKKNNVFFALECLGAEKVMCFLHSFSEVKLILDYLLPFEKFQFLTRFIEIAKLKSMLDAGALQTYLYQCKNEDFQLLYNSIGPAHFESLIDTLECLHSVLDKLSTEQQRECVTYVLTPTKINQLLPSSEDFITFINMFSSNVQKAMILRFSADEFKRFKFSHFLAVKLLESFSLDEQKLFIESTLDVSRIVDVYRYDAVYYIVRHVYLSSQIAFLQKFKPEELSELFLSADTILAMLDVLQEKARFAFLNYIEPQKLQRFFKGSSTLSVALARFDAYRANPNIYKPLLALFARLCIEDLRAEGEGDISSLTYKIAAEKLLAVIEGVEFKDSLNIYVSQLRQGDVGIVYQRFLEVYGYVPTEPIPIRQPAANPRLFRPLLLPSPAPMQGLPQDLRQPRAYNRRERL